MQQRQGFGMLLACLVVGCGSAERDGEHEPSERPPELDSEWRPDSVVLDRVSPDPARPGDRLLLEGTFPGTGLSVWLNVGTREGPVLSFSNSRIETELRDDEIAPRVAVSVIIRDVQSNHYYIDVIHPDPTPTPVEPSPGDGGATANLAPDTIAPGEFFFVAEQPHWGPVTAFLFDEVPSPAFEPAPLTYRVQAPLELVPGTEVTLSVVHDGGRETLGTSQVIAP